MQELLLPAISASILISIFPIMQISIRQKVQHRIHRMTKYINQSAGIQFNLLSKTDGFCKMI